MPGSPGVYRFLDEKKEPLYIGKAKNLKKRVQTYFRKSAKHSPRIEKMLDKVDQIEWTETNNEIEALVLEDNLVKELQPKYNILLRDDKNFQYIKVTVDEDYPQIYTVRRITKDHAKGRAGGSKYFGPKTSGSDVKKLLESAKRIFKLCSVRNIKLDPKGTPLKNAKVAVKVGGTAAKRPCLDYYIKRCVGPCAGMVTPEEYREHINQAIQFLEGDFKPALQMLKEQMMEFAAGKKFERAAKLRDHIGAIERSQEKQLITNTDIEDRDVIGFVEDLGRNFFNLFQIRAGRLIGQENFSSFAPASAGASAKASDDKSSFSKASANSTPSEIMETFLRDYYALAADIPKEVLISVELEKPKLMQDYIRSFTDKAVNLIHPQVGKKDDIVSLAEKNARSFAQQSRVRWMADEKKGEAALEELQKALKLKEIPKRIECYDISHLSGTETVGSMVVFKKGEPVPADYRQFRLKSTQGQIDDFKSMAEVLRRRLNYLPAELPKGYKLQKAKKKDEKFFWSVWDKMERFDVKQFYVVRKEAPGLKPRVTKGAKKKAPKSDGDIVAFGRIDPISDKVHRIAGLWVSDKERGKKLGHFIMKKLIETSKQKRLYLFCHKELENYYFKLGWETLHQPPAELAKHASKYLDDLVPNSSRMASESPDAKKTGTSHTQAIRKQSEPLYMAYQKKKKDFSFESKPDLIVIDGGKGQLSAAHDAMFERGVNIPMIALAKRLEEVFVPGRSEPIELKSDTEASYLLQRIRDEAHRFAIEHNRSSRDKKMTQSALDGIAGVGPKMKKKLLTYYGSVHKIREASQVELEQICGEAVAKKLKENL